MFFHQLIRGYKAQTLNPHDTRCLHVEQQDFMDALSRQVPDIGGAGLSLGSRVSDPKGPCGYMGYTWALK